MLPAGTKCATCGGTTFKKEMDILDVWFESGSSYLALRAAEPQCPPADLYLEGGDQHRGWFHSSLLCAVGSATSRALQGRRNRGLDTRREWPGDVQVARQ